MSPAENEQPQAYAAGVAPPKNTGGGGFVFEDDVCAWLLACMLVREPPFDTDLGSPIRLDFQTRADGWFLDDVLVTTAAGTGLYRFALSVKSNAQFTATTAPADFVGCAWENWLHVGSNKFERTTDFLGMVTATVSSAARGSLTGLLEKAKVADPELFPARLAREKWANENERELFASFACPAALAEGTNVDEAETLRLVQRVRWRQHDFGASGSESLNSAMRMCRQALRGSTQGDAENLWNALRALAAELRPVAGSITRVGLVARLRERFTLAEHPDHEADWQKLDAQSSWAATQVPNAIDGRIKLQRDAEFAAIRETLESDEFVALVGTSGGGKSAMARALLEARTTSGQRTLWFDGRSFEQVDFNAFEANLRLKYPLDELLGAEARAEPMLILDGLDRLYSDAAFRNVSMLLRTARQALPSAQWRIVVPCQTQEWPRVLEGLQRAGFAGGPWKDVELQRPSADDLASVSASIPELKKLLLMPRVGRLLQNLKMLDLVARRMAAGTNVDATRWVGESSIADWFWSAEVDRGADRIARGSFARRLAQAQADHLIAAVPVDDFGIGELGPLESLAADRICLQVSGDRLTFGHDLFGDWARLRVLIGHRADLNEFLRSRIDSPLWHRAVRLMGVHLLEQEDGIGEWRKAMASASAEGLDGVRDLLLEAPIFAVNARPLLDAIRDDLFANEGALLRRVLTRFLAFATVPNQQTLAFAEAMGFDPTVARATHRWPYWPYWLDVLGFLHAHGAAVVAMASQQVAQIVEMWLAYVPEGSVLRDEAAELAVLLGRRALATRDVYGDRDWERNRQRFYTCVLASAKERTDDVVDVVLTASARKVPAPAGADDTPTEPRRRQRRAPTAPPWPDGPLEDVDEAFRNAVLDGGNGVLALFGVRPDVAREVILACLIEPPRDRDVGYASLGWRKRELAVVERYSWHPPLYLHGPFLACLRTDFAEGLELIAQLVEFATERWRDRAMTENVERRTTAIAQGHSEAEVDEALRVGRPMEVSVGHGEEARRFTGDSEVYGWSGHLGSPPEAITSALMALEQYFYQQLDEEQEIASQIAEVLGRAKTTAFLKVLCNVGKRQPELFEGPLRPLLATHELYRWDIDETIQGRYHLMIGAIDKGEWFAKLARQFGEQEHRKIDLRTLAAYLMIYRQPMRAYFQEAVEHWKAVRSATPEDAFPMLNQLIVSLDPENYQSEEHPEHGTILVNVVAARLHEEQEEERRALDEQVLVTAFPMRCRKVLEGTESLSSDDLKILWQQWRRIQELAEQGPELPDGSERLGDEYANAITGGIAVFLRHREWCDDEPSRTGEVIAALRKVIAVPPRPNRFDTPDSISTWSWDCFVAEALAMLWLREPANAEWKEGVARMIFAPHYAAVTLLFARCAAHREVLGQDFGRLRRLGLEAAYLRDRAELLARVQPESLDLDVPAIERLRGTVAAFWDQRVAAFVSGSIGTMPSNWSECDAPEQFSELDAARGRWRRARTLDFHIVRCAHAWLPLPDGAANERERRDWIQFWRSALAVTLARPRALRNGDSHRFPGEDERWVLSAVAAVVLQMRPEESPEDLWKPILDLCGERDDWPEAFAQALHLIALTDEKVPESYPETMRRIVQYAFTRVEGQRRWAGFEGVWDALIGVDGYSSRYWEPKHAETATSVSDVLDQWMADVPRNSRRLERFATWLARPAASPVRLRSLTWVLASLRVNGKDRRDVGEAEDAIAALLNVVWREDEARLRQDKDAFNAFRGLLSWLADRQNAFGLELLGRIGSLA